MHLILNIFYSSPGIILRQIVSKFGLAYSNFYLNHVVIHSEDIRMPKFIAKVQTPLPEEIIPVDPLPERCFYEKHAINLKLWKNTLPAFVDR